MSYVRPTLAALALVLGVAGRALAAPEEVVLESPALGFKLRFPEQPDVYHFEANDGTGWSRAHQWVARRGKGKTEQGWELKVLQHAELRLPPEKALERLLAGDTSRGEEILSQSAREHEGRHELRARLRSPAADGSPSLERRALYAIAHGLVYVLKYESDPAHPGGAGPWDRFEAGLELFAPVVSHDWLPHLSGRGGFSALFPVDPGAEREDEVEVGGRAVTGVIVAAAEAGRWELVVSAHPVPQVAAGRRGGAKADAGARDAALAAARSRAQEGLSDPVLERDEVLRPGCRELVMTGQAEGVPALRIARITLGEEALVVARATGFGAEPPRAVLEAFVAAARPVPRFDGKLLAIASPEAALSGATLGTGERLSGSSGSYAKSGRYTFDIHTSDMTMARAEFRAGEAEYLRRPALGSGYSALWKLRKTREVTLDDGAGFARSYVTRDGDDVLAIHERVTVDAEGYRCHSTVIRNRAVDPAHLEHLFRPGK